MLLFCMIVGIGSAWGETKSVTYTITSTSAVSASENAPDGSSATFYQTYNNRFQMTKGNNMTLTLAGYDGKKITAITLSMKSNTSAGAGYLSVKAGEEDIASIGSSSSGVAFNNAEWNGVYTTSYTNVTPTLKNDSYIVKDGEKIVIEIGATTNSLYCQSFTITYGDDDTTPEQPTKYNVNIDSNISGGTISATPTSAAEGTEITLEATPDDGYQLDSWYVLDGDANEITVTDNKFKMPASDVEVSAKFERESPVDESYLFYESFNDNNGTGGNDGKWGGSIALSDAKFDNIGWVKVSVTGADACIKIGTKSTTGYVTLPSINYSGDCTLTFKAASWSGDNTSIIIKVGEEAIKTFELSDGAWEDFEVSISGLKNDTSIKISSSERGHRFFLDEVKIVKVDSQEPQDPDTPPTPKATITLNSACTDGDYVYGTYSNSSAFVVPENLVVSEISIIDDALYVESYNTGAIVPANTGVMVSALEGGDYTVSLSNEVGTSVLGDSNYLHPSSEAMTGDNLFYRLTMHNDTQIGYWWGAENGAAFNLGANKAYLAVPSRTSVKANLWFGGVETSISAPEALNAENGVIYNLNGQRVSSATKGIYIKNGKKYFVK